MPRVSFTPNLNRHLDCPTAHVVAATLGETLEAVFAGNPRLRGYVLDDQGAIRRHVAVFVDNKPVVDRVNQSDPVRADSEVFVMQALSGG
ncbi:MAG: MoaD/ThiS family protein [Planctomycetaceae bacterium]|nr:MoaD/ThiS family protein [Planctomycetaceae bacterium]